MSRPLIQDSYDPLEDSDISDFEAELGGPLPDAYRQLLLHHNGGFFADNVYFDREPSGELSGHVDGLYGINTDTIAWDIRATIRAYQGAFGNRTGERIPTDLIPIGQTPAGELCIGVAGQVVGEVYWWSRDEESSSPWENCYFIADGFARFWANLTRECRAECDESLTPFLAIEMGDLDALRSYLTSGGDPNTRNQLGWTLLMRAALSKRVAAVRMLLDVEADLHACDAEGQTALHFCRSTDVMKLLLANGVNPNAQDKRGFTALMYAVNDDAGYRVRILLRHGAAVNLRSERGDTALSLCTSPEPRDGIRAMLLDAGAVA